MGQKIPYIVGNTINRDHFQFRTLTADPTDSGPPGVWEDSFFPIAPGLDKMMKWLWRVKDWKINGGMVADITTGRGSTANVTITATDLIVPNLLRHLTSPPTAGFLGGWDIGPVTTERELLAYFRDPDSGLYTNGLGNYGPSLNADVTGAATVSGSSSSVDYPGLTMSWTSTGGGIGSGTFKFSSLSFGLFFQMETTDPMQYSYPASLADVLQFLLLWDDASGGIRPQIECGWAGNFQLQGGIASAIHYFINTSTDSFEFGQPVTFPDFTLDGEGIRQKGDAWSNGVSGSDAFGSDTVGVTTTDPALTMEPNSYFEYANKAGDPVYDSTTGAQINDPFG